MNEGRAGSVLLAVTSDVSLRLLSGFPGFLSERGWSVEVVCAPGPGVDAFRREEGVVVHTIPMRREISPVHDVRALSQWMRLMRRTRPDVVWVGTPKAALLGTVAARLAGVPRRLYVLRGLRLETLRGWRRLASSWAERLTARASQRIVAVSGSLASRYVELGLAPAQKVVVPASGSSHGVNLARFGPRAVPASEVRRLRAELGLVGDRPVIGFVGRLTVDKGLLVLVAACRILEDRRVPFDLVVVGGLDDAGLPSGWDADSAARVRLVGAVAEPAAYYRVFDLLCLPTLREGFPNVVLEAAASGIPTVTTTATGAVDAVVDGVTGAVAAVGDAVDLAEKLSLLLGDAELRRAMGRAARRRAKREFAREIVWAAHEAVMRDDRAAA